MILKPKLHKGKYSKDKRGIIFHNNDFDFEKITRAYLIKNASLEVKRGWKGHAIERRWFLCTAGRIKVSVISLESLSNKINDSIHFELNDSNLDILEVPAGYATMIQQKKINSSILCFSDYRLNTSNDEELRWPEDYLEL